MRAGIAALATVFIFCCCFSVGAFADDVKPTQIGVVEPAKPEAAAVVKTVVTSDPVSLQQAEIKKDDDSVPYARTATGGFINTIMVFLSVVAFVGNGAFMVYVFWLSK
jgi:hypothetical protein